MSHHAETPAALGYRFPAEWEPHAATWLSWPRNRDSWPGKFEPVPAIWAGLVRILAEYEPVNVLAGGSEVLAEATAMVGQIPGVTLWDIPTNDAWTRDHGPMFLKAPQGAPPALIDWEYNAWGGKYPPFDDDNRVPGILAEKLGFRRFSPGIVLEGGAVDGNGRGAILTTEECLLNPNRNPGLGRDEVEKYLRNYCGAKKVLWLGRGIAGDDTDGHIDQLARFVGPRTVLAPLEDDPTDDNHEPLRENFTRLQAMSDQDGQPLEIIALPMPRPVYFEGQRLPAGYANFYIANGVVVAPTYNDPADETAIATLARCFPDREIRALDSVDLILGLGAIHCITQQQPR